MADADVIVVGGSVAGAATACFLARAGHHVTVLDRARFPRDKPCGEGLMPHGVDVLTDLGLAETARAASRELGGVRYTLANGATVVGQFRAARPGASQCALGITRIVLDALLVNEASRLGAEIVESFRVRDLLWDNARPVGVSDGARTLRAPILVGADGLNSTVRRLLGWERARGRPRRWAVTAHVALAEGRRIPPEVFVALIPGAEAYVTPLAERRALVALLGGRSLLAGFKGDLRGGFGRALRSIAPLRSLLDGAELLPELRAIGPFGVRARRVAGAGVLLVGDAAGFLDPITGEGMASALQQARAAARLIDRSLARGSWDLAAFVAAHRRLTRGPALLTWMALALCASPSLAERALRGLQRRPDLFSKLLAINGGASFSSLSLRDYVALATGR